MQRHIPSFLIALPLCACIVSFMRGRRRDTFVKYVQHKFCSAPHLQLSSDTAAPTAAVALQALVEQPPVHPNDVLREIVELAQLPSSEALYEDDEAQFDDQAGLEEDADLADVELDGSPEADMSYGQQNFPPTQESGQSDMGGGGSAWSDDSFTDAALDDEAFEASGFDVVDQS